jgi:hypothetical protein
MPRDLDEAGHAVFEGMGKINEHWGLLSPLLD